MPITTSAKNALRQDRRRNRVNHTTRQHLKKAIKISRRQPSKKNLQEAYRQLDRAAKKKVLHSNKAARLKSRLAHLLT